MTPQQRAEYALGRVMEKQAKGELGGAGYLIPYYRSGLGVRDALKSFALMGMNNRFGNKRMAWANGLGGLGNLALASADFLPGVGTAASTAINASRLARLGRVGKALGTASKFTKMPFQAAGRQVNNMWAKFPAIQQLLSKLNITPNKVAIPGMIAGSTGDFYGNPFYY